MPSVSVSLTDEEYSKILKVANRNKKSAGQQVAEFVRMFLEA